jgi:hypothetical protein
LHGIPFVWIIFGQLPTCIQRHGKMKAKRGFSFPLCFAGDFSYVQLYSFFTQNPFFCEYVVSYVIFLLCALFFDNCQPARKHMERKKRLKEDLVSLYVLLEIFHMSSSFFFTQNPFFCEYVVSFM